MSITSRMTLDASRPLNVCACTRVPHTKYGKHATFPWLNMCIVTGQLTSRQRETPWVIDEPWNRSSGERIPRTKRFIAEIADLTRYQEDPVEKSSACSAKIWRNALCIQRGCGNVAIRNPKIHLSARKSYTFSNGEPLAHRIAETLWYHIARTLYNSARPIKCHRFPEWRKQERGTGGGTLMRHIDESIN